MSESSNEGYVDLQVNGFGGVDFNADDLTAQSLHAACLKMQEDGAAGFLPTVITADIDLMVSRLARIAEFRRADSLAEEMILGIHIEGPFISAAPGFVGAHPLEAVRVPNLPDMERLLEATDGLTRIVTLAPELDKDLRVTRFLADQGIIVAGGHCDPSLDQLRAAVDAGLTMFTHLGNGCPLELPRHDNIIQRVLSLSDKIWISLIADGAHVPFHALGNYLSAANLERCVIVSDAISATGLGPGRYTLGDQTIDVDEACVPRIAGKSGLAGSATSVTQMIERLRENLDISEESLHQLTVTGPQTLLASG